MSAIIESVKSFISTCPYPEEQYARIRVDFLPGEATTYSIEETPVQTVLIQDK